MSASERRLIALRRTILRAFDEAERELVRLAARASKGRPRRTRRSR